MTTKKTPAIMSVVRSEQLPATRKPVKWRDFNRFVGEVDELCEYLRELNLLRSGRADDDYRTSGNVEADAEDTRELVDKCKAGFERFDRADNHDADGTLAETYVANRLGMMIGAFPNANPGMPQNYARWSSTSPRSTA